jgi:predicted Fe-Mo cluster-binding NifX family protein
MQVPFWGSLPLDPEIAASGDQGTPFVSKFAGSRTAELMKTILRPILDRTEGTVPPILQGEEKEDMRIAVPFAEGVLSTHFGHCEQFALLDVDQKSKKILKRQDVEAPPHEPGLLPRWLAAQKVQLVIAGGMGQRARDLFTEQGITVVIGAPAWSPERLVQEHLAGTLKTGDNVCDH